MKKLDNFSNCLSILKMLILGLQKQMIFTEQALLVSLILLLN